MSTLAQFVDKIDAAPTVLFDCNTAPVHLSRGVTLAPPPLVQPIAQSMLLDGGVVGESRYGPRLIQLPLRIEGNVETCQTQLSRLMRELNKTTNLLRWQADGATHPVFFRTYRTAPEAVDLSTWSADRQMVEVRLLAEPFAYGLMETVGPFSVTNDPAGVNDPIFDVTGVLGDVPTPPLIVNEAGTPPGGILAVRQDGLPSSELFARQAEDATLGTDTTNPGGGPDVAMSGAGTNNFVQTSFATQTVMVSRLTFASPGQDPKWRGLSRIMAVVRRSDFTSDIQVRAKVGNLDLPDVTVPKAATRQLLDLGVIDLSAEGPAFKGLSSTAWNATSAAIQLLAARTSGAGTLDWDCLLVLPASAATLMWSPSSTKTGVAAPFLAIDSTTERMFEYELSSDPFHVAARLYFDNFPLQVAGAFPMLVPGQTNRFYLLVQHAGDATLPWKEHRVDTASTIKVRYWPRYLHVRPATP